MKKLIFLCNFSSQATRNRLHLRKYAITNWVHRLFNKTPLSYVDTAVWYGRYIDLLKKYCEDFELHIVSPHDGMYYPTEEFIIDGTFYHYYTTGFGYLLETIERRLNIHQKTDFYGPRRRFRKILEKINPDVVLLCGAENPIYSNCILDVKKCPTVVILQTLLNDPKRIALNVGNDYRREQENLILKHSNCFIAPDMSVESYITSINHSAKIISLPFVTNVPLIDNTIKKEYDYAFFGARIQASKGLTDTIKALKMVVNKHPKVTLNIIGTITNIEYQDEVNQLIATLKLKENIVFTPLFPQIEDAYREVQKARAVVVPGITALNSTVRESMMMRLPTILYRINGFDEMFTEENCVFSAPVNDYQELSRLMIVTLEQTDIADEVATNGYKYAQRVFGGEIIGMGLKQTLKELCFK